MFCIFECSLHNSCKMDLLIEAAIIYCHQKVPSESKPVSQGFMIDYKVLKGNHNCVCKFPILIQLSRESKARQIRNLYRTREYQKMYKAGKRKLRTVVLLHLHKICLDVRRTSILSSSALVSQQRNRTDTEKSIVNYLSRVIVQRRLGAWKCP